MLVNRGVDAMASSKTAEAVFLKDYRPPGFDIPEIVLHFEIQSGNQVQVTHTATFLKKTDASVLRLNGNSGLLTLKSIRMDKEILDADQYCIENNGDLCIPGIAEESTLEIITELHPEDNSECIGLYTSEGSICTQCESEGFRNITYSLDRPDLLSRFTVTIQASAKEYPYLLSNGKQTKSAVLENGFHEVTWEDSRPKPTYLFALAAGDFDVVRDSFRYPDGKEVALRHYVNKGDAAKARHAMSCLKSAMAHEYERWGHQYHSDSAVFMTLAVDAFVFGAMENTGLNIFNSAAILADSQTATDRRFARIDDVVDHEFCHDESGNWAVPRDWFQVAFKEGLTVFRDQTYSADRYGKTLQRIKDVRQVRDAVFAYDSGTMTHPMVLSSYVKTENNYDVLTYPKGAEVNRMLEALVGRESYRRAYRHFFDTHGEKATTLKEYYTEISKASGRELEQFIETWLHQAGVPLLEVSSSYLASEEKYRLSIRQLLPVTADDPATIKRPFHIPLKIGLVGPDGADYPLPDGGFLEILEEKNEFTFTGITAKPRLSLNRDALAYAKFIHPDASEVSTEDLAFLALHDSNEFKRWDALQELMLARLQEALESGNGEGAPTVDIVRVTAPVIPAFRSVLEDEELENGLKAEMLSVPSVNTLANLQPRGTVDPLSLYATRQLFVRAIAEALSGLFLETYKSKMSDAAYTFTPGEMNRRSLMNRCLGYLAVLESSSGIELAREQFMAQNNFNDLLAAAQLIIDYGSASMREEVVKAMYARWSDDKLVMNNWLALQATAESTTIERLETLAEDPVFSARNPNKVRSLIGSFKENIPNFHKKDGSGYRFMADWIIRMDSSNATIAASLASFFTRIADYQSDRQQQLNEQMVRIRKTRGTRLSPNVTEILNRSRLKPNQDDQ